MGVLTETIVPIFGNILATAMLVSPIPAVLVIRRTGKLGDINPLPYPMTCINAAGWVAYGYAVANPYIFPANVIGFLAGLFFTMTAFTYATRKMQDFMMAMMIAATAYFIMLGLISCFSLTPTQSTRMWGNSAVVILMGYYVVPLSSMVRIVRTRNAASIYPPLAATAIANGAMWTIYGIAIQDIDLWLPNGFGAIIGTVQLGLRLLYGARPSSDAATTDIALETLRDEDATFTAERKTCEERVDSASNLLTPGLHGSAAVRSRQEGGGTADSAINGDVRPNPAPAARLAQPPPDPGHPGPL